MVDLTGKVAIITGSGANIGEACARTLAAAGAKIVLADINLAGATAVAARIVAKGGEAFAQPLDLVDEASIAAVIAAALARWGRIDVLHNNAADTSLEQMAADGSLLALDAAIWDRAMAVNARGTMLMIKHALPAMIAQGGGSIINTSSGVSILGDLFNPAYSASKGAVNTLTRNVATQFGKANIRCNAVLPGMIVTPHAEKMMSAEQLAMIERSTLLPRLGKPQDIADTVAFLASEAASFITGQIFSVDGGITTHQPYFADAMAMFG